MVSKKSARKINNLLNWVNAFLLLGIMTMVGKLFLDSFREKSSSSGTVVLVEENGLVKMYVIEDRAFQGYLNNKMVRVISLNPLFLEVLPAGIQVEKAGRWETVSYDHTAEIRNLYLPQIFIKGSLTEHPR
ncbi:MAG: hypothetical protein QW212_01095 [Nitrososphaerales archaeon]